MSDDFETGVMFRELAGLFNGAERANVVAEMKLEKEDAAAARLLYGLLAEDGLSPGTAMLLLQMTAAMLVSLTAVMDLDKLSAMMQQDDTTRGTWKFMNAMLEAFDDDVNAAFHIVADAVFWLTLCGASRRHISVRVDSTRYAYEKAQEEPA
jgi:hypothetical protein